MADEHYVSSYIRGKLFGLLQAYQTPDSRGPLVYTACAPDEWHEVGILIVSIFLARRGYTGEAARSAVDRVLRADG